jgi:hypothetical protein
VLSKGRAESEKERCADRETTLMLPIVYSQTFGRFISEDDRMRSILALVAAVITALDRLDDAGELRARRRVGASDDGLWSESARAGTLVVPTQAVC